MPIKNYTTTIEANKTVAEIQIILSKNGAKRVSMDFAGGGEPEAVSFWLNVHHNSFSFRLPANPVGVLNTMKRDGVPARHCTLEQARRVSWRIIKDWLAAQIAIVDAGQAKMSEVFFPYLLDSSGETYYSQFENSQKRLHD